MRLIVLLTAAAAAATLAATATVSTAATDRPTGPWAYHFDAMPPLAPPVWLSTIDRVRSETGRCQARAELAPARAEYSRTDLRRAGHAFRGWVLDRWRERLAACKRVAARTLPATHDWLTAVRIVQRAFPGSEWWLEACSSSEGSHGPWVWRGGEPVKLAGTFPNVTPMNDHGNVPGGPMQYFQSTFWGDYNAAVADLRAQGFRVPRSASSWYSPLGQAVAAGWAYNHDRPAGKWTGGRC